MKVCSFCGNSCSAGESFCSSYCELQYATLKERLVFFGSDIRLAENEITDFISKLTPEHRGSILSILDFVTGVRSAYRDSLPHN